MIDDIALEVASGISTGGDKIFRVNENTISEHNLESEILHNVLVGREINCYEINSTNHKIIYTARDTKIDHFPHVKEYLTPYKEKLETRSETKKGILPWYALGRQRNTALFTEPKILLRQTADSVISTFDESGFFVLNSILVFKIDQKFNIEYKFALSILNSKLTTFIYRNLTQEEGRGFAEVKPKNIRKLFIPKTSEEDQKLFVILVDSIMWLKAIDESIDNYVDNEHIAKLFEDLIDAMVLELYFKEEMKEAGFDFIAHATKLFKSIENHSDSETKDIINNAYQSLREKDNPIRNDLQLLPIRVPMVAPILESI